MKTKTISEARKHLPELIDEVNEDLEAVIVTRWDQPVAKIIPFKQIDEGKGAYPLRGMPVKMSDDFNEPMDSLWEATQA